MSEKIYLASPHMSAEGFEMEYVQEAFATNWIAPLGPNVNEFENELADYVKCESALALASGTGALHLSLIAAGVGKDDIVLCQSLTFSASANPIMYQHAKPVFIDSDMDSWNMCPKALEEALIKYPNAKAVIVVHLYGLTAKLDEIKALCDQYNVTLIEDAAESLGSYYKGIHTGTIGDYGIYSFNGNKIITTSGGGMLISKYPDKLSKAKFWATQARDQARHYQHSELGFNYRMSNVLAGIGRGQLKVLDRRVKKKKEIYEYYKTHLGHLDGVEFMPENEWCDANYWLSCIVLTGKVRPLDIIEALEKENIESRPIWKPMHLQPFYEEFDYIGTDVSQYLFENGVCLPSDSKMSTNDLNRISQCIIRLWNNPTK